MLIRTDSGGGAREEFLAWLSRPGRRLHISLGLTITEDMEGILAPAGLGLEGGL